MVSTRPSLSFFLAMETNRSYNAAVTARLALFTQRLRTFNVARLDKMAANSVRTHRVLSLRRGRVARVSSAGSPRRTRQTLNAEAIPRFTVPPRRPARGHRLTTTPPFPRISRSKRLVARRPPSRWSTARLARVSFASTVRVSRANARDAGDDARKIFRVHRRRRWRASGGSNGVSRVGAARVADGCRVDASARADDRSRAAPDPGKMPRARRRHRVFSRAKRCSTFSARATRSAALFRLSHRL